MHRQFVAVCAIIGMGWAGSSVAQPAAADIPLTYEAFSRLTVEQAARRLIGASGALVSKMILGHPPGYSGAPLSVVRFFSTPRASEPGLCRNNEIDIWFETEDGRPGGSANTSTPMKISGIASSYGYFVAGEVNARASEQQNRNLEQTCARLDRPLEFFTAANSTQAWEAAFLVDFAIREARAHGPQAMVLACKASSCDDVNASFARLSSRAIFEVSAGCNRPDSASNACYSVRLSDSSNSSRSWVVYVEAARGRELTLQTSTLTLVSQPIL